MYVGRSPSDDMRVPEHYHGVAVDEDGVLRGVAAHDEDLRRAEEMFRRGYVFESDNDTQNAASVPEEDSGGTEFSSGTDGTDSIDNVHTQADEHVGAEQKTVQADDIPASAKPVQKSTGGLLSGLLGRISSEDIILIGLIIILFGSGADDQLLIMLAILLIC